jgi:ribose-phosphate pyrophosphokinase
MSTSLPNKCFLVYDPNGGAKNLTESIYDSVETRMRGLFELNEVIFDKFRMGETKLNIEKNVRRGHCFYIADSNDDPNQWFAKSALLNHTLENSSAKEIIDVFPHLIYSRQDRKDQARVPMSARVVADVIQLYADKVLTVDVHSYQTQMLYKRFDSLPSFRTVAEYLTEKHPEILTDNLVIASPDAGGGTRAVGFGRRLGDKNVAIGHKLRKDGEAEKVEFAESQVSGCDILLVDDIIDSGGTLIKAIDGLKAKNAGKIYVYGTHGFFTEGYDDLLEKVDRVFIGDTITQPYLKNPHYQSEEGLPKIVDEKLEVISFAPIIADAIYATATGGSLSDLFGGPDYI